MYGQVRSPQSEPLKKHDGSDIEAVLEAVHDRKSMMEGATEHLTSTKLGATFSSCAQKRRGRSKGLTLHHRLQIVMEGCGCRCNSAALHGHC